MGAPKLTINIEPMQGGSITYLPLAAAVSGDKPQFKLVLRLTITNLEAIALLIEAIEFSFPASNVLPIQMQQVSLAIPPGQQKLWSNGAIDGGSNVVYLDMPAPVDVEVSVKAIGFSDPVSVGGALNPYQSSQPGGGLLFPFSIVDNRAGEQPTTSAVHWSNGGAPGTQIFAHDISFHSGGDRLLPGADSSKNESYRCWGKPIRAMGDGTVVDILDGMPNSQHLGSFPTPTPSNVSGNYVKVQYTDVTVMCVHMQPGSLGVGVGTTVKAGDVLGLVGSSGNVTEPHTHVECHRASDEALQPIPFRDCWVVKENKLNPPDPAGPWVKVQGQGIPVDTVAIWASASQPAWFLPGLDEICQWAIAADHYQAVVDHASSSGYRLVWVNPYSVKGDTFFNAIFRPANGVGWYARHGLDGTQYQSEFNNQGKAGLRLCNVASYLDGGNVRYAAIWAKTPSPATAVAYHGTKAADHQQRVTQFRQQGLTPVNVSVVSVNGERHFTALWEKIDAGAWDLASMMTPQDYQNEWNQQTAAGRSLAYLSVYPFSGGVRFSAIFQEKVAGTGGTGGLHNINVHTLKSQYDLERSNGALTRVLAGYEWGGDHAFGVAWRAGSAGVLGAAGGIG